jgi:hypothetical protein
MWLTIGLIVGFVAGVVCFASLIMWSVERN